MNTMINILIWGHYCMLGLSTPLVWGKHHEKTDHFRSFEVVFTQLVRENMSFSPNMIQSNTNYCY